MVLLFGWFRYSRNQSCLLDMSTKYWRLFCALRGRKLGFGVFCFIPELTYTAWFNFWTARIIRPRTNSLLTSTKEGTCEFRTNSYGLRHPNNANSSYELGNNRGEERCRFHFSLTQYPDLLDSANSQRSGYAVVFNEDTRRSIFIKPTVAPRAIFALHGEQCFKVTIVQ